MNIIIGYGLFNIIDITLYISMIYTIKRKMDCMHFEENKDDLNID